MTDMAKLVAATQDVEGSGVVRSLTRAWFVALGIVAVLTVIAQIIIQLALARAELDARVMNLAGRQRMLSQAMTKAALDYHREPTTTRAQILENWREDWLSGHELLARGRDLPGAGKDNSPAVAAQFAELEPIVQDMLLVSTPQAVTADIGQLLALEPEFLVRMDHLVDTYQLESTARVTRVRILELVIHGLLIAVLVVEAWFVFRPTVGRLREGLRLRAELTRKQIDEQVLATEARVATRIGQDLHDDLGQQLTACSITAGRLVAELGHHPLAYQLTQDLSKAVASTRTVARRLAPASIHQGLHHALRDLCESTAACSVSCEYNGESLPELPPTAAEDCLRIAQEAVNNALRHAEPRSIAISLARDSNRIHLIVRDDGNGRLQQRPEGLGLHSMRMRAERLGGQLHLEGIPDQGTIIHLDIPRPPPALEPALEKAPRAS